MMTAEGAASDYDTDILLWSEQQAELLRSRAANALDGDNIAEEIVDVGRSELRAVASHLVQALLHDLKAEALPLSREVPHWRAEARGHRDDARAAVTQSSRRTVELKALRAEFERRLDRLDFRSEGSGLALTAPSRPSSQRAQVNILRQSRRLYGCWPLKGAFSQPLESNAKIEGCRRREPCAQRQRQIRHATISGSRADSVYSRICQTLTASPAEPGELPLD